MINNDSVCIVKYIAYANTRLLHFSHINYHQDENAVSGDIYWTKPPAREAAGRVVLSLWFVLCVSVCVSVCLIYANMVHNLEGIGYVEFEHLH